MSADPAFADFNSYPLAAEGDPGITLTVVTEDEEDINDARAALNEDGKRIDYEEFRREQGLK